MFKVEINAEKSREVPEVNLFTEETNVLSFSVGQTRVNPASPSDFNGDQEKGQVLLNTCHIHFSICEDSF